MATVTVERANITDEEREEVLKRGAYIAALMLRDIMQKQAEQIQQEAKKELE